MSGVAGVMRFSQWAQDPRQTNRWKRVRKQMLIAYPRCELCGSRCATEVHHRKSAILHRDLAFDMDWCLRSVCHWCHKIADSKPDHHISWRPRPDRTPPRG